MTVLVAWGFAWGTAPESKIPPTFAVDLGRPPATLFVVLKMTGLTSVSCFRELESAAEVQQALEIYEPVALPRFARHLTLARPVPEPPGKMSVLAFGWPWRAMSFEIRQVDSIDNAAFNARVRYAEPYGDLVIPGAALRGRSQINETDLALPLLPLWRGLIANTLFYALLVWLLRRGFVFVRGWRRRRKGRCGWRGGCGYDLSGSVGEVCPECGRPVGGGGGRVATAELAE